MFVARTMNSRTAPGCVAVVEVMTLVDIDNGVNGTSIKCAPADKREMMSANTHNASTE